MSFIPIYIPPQEDELLYSWIVRLAHANEMSLSDFLVTYTRKDRIKPGGWNVDMKVFAADICNRLRIKVNMCELFSQHTPFNSYAMLLSRDGQTRYINSMFREITPLNTPVNTIINKVCYCPECAKEDPFPMLHVSHNLRDIRVCIKHKIPLLSYEGIRGREFYFNEKKYKPIDLRGSLESELLYAQYINSINKFTINYDIKDVKEVLYEKLQSLGYTAKDKYESLRIDLKNWPHSALLHLDLVSFLKIKMINASYIFPSELIPLLMFLWPNPNDFLSNFKEQPLILNNYLCETCQTPYVSTVKAQNDGWGCPQCTDEYTAQEHFERIVARLGQDEYEVVGEFEALDEAIEMKHKTCGEFSRIKPRSFLFEGVRCSCRNTITYAEAKRTIELDGRFKLIHFQSSNRPVSIQHNKCGQTFEYNYGHFIRAFCCKACNSAAGIDMTHDLYAFRVKNLVGDEYSFVTEFKNQDTKIVLKHEVCGNEQEYWPSTFLDGQRCRHCHKPMTHVELNNLLVEYSNGRYSITKHGRNLYTIYDSEEQKEIQLPPLKIRQEIVRPTMSEILPVKPELKKQYSIVSTWDVGFNHLVRYKEDNGHTNIAKRATYRGYNLGEWCNRQRQEYKNGILKSDRYYKLKEIGFIFDPMVEEWNRRCEQYKRYIEQTGTTYISRRTDFEGEHLGAWVETQRKMYNAGKLTQARIDKLLDINTSLFTKE